jgi:hypothetical protein
VGTSAQPEALFVPAPTTTGVTRLDTADQLVRGGSTPVSTAVGPGLPATGPAQRPDRAATLAAVVVLCGAALSLVARRPRSNRAL